MPGPSREIQLRLYRDALSTPWGFRLQGGRDLKLALTVQKVNLGSPVDGELCRGDVLLEIQNCDATMMSHQKAQELIKNSGGSLLLRVKRSIHNEPQPAPAPPTAQQQGFMLHRVQDTLTTLRFDPYASTEPSSTGALLKIQQELQRNRQNNYQLYSSPSGATTLFSSVSTPKHSKYPDRLYSTLPKQKNTPQIPTGLSEPGWTPKQVTHTVRSRPSSSRRATYPAAPPVAPAPMAPVNRPRSLEPERPAWEGSLRSFVNPRPVDMRLHDVGHQTQIAHFSPVGSPQVRQNSSPWNQESETARAVNLQYNSPLALYSRSTAEESLRGQTSRKFGNAQAKGDIYSLVQENDRRTTTARDARRILPPQLQSSYEDNQMMNDMFTDF